MTSINLQPEIVKDTASVHDLPALADIYEQAVTREMAEEGFEPGAPPHIMHFTISVDAGVARRVKCRSCARRGGRFLAFHRGSQYRAASVCKCGTWREL